jgi:hypothetical protein
MKPSQIIATIVVGAFVVERITNGLLFLLSYLKWWKQKFPEPELQKTHVGRYAAQKDAKLIYFCVAGPLTSAFLMFNKGIGVLGLLKVQPSPIADFFISWLVIVAGSGQISEILKLYKGDGAEEAGEKPIEVTGIIHLHQEKERSDAAHV